MSNTPLTYTLKKASQLIGIDADNFQSLYVEGKLRLAYLNIYNGKPILGYLPQKSLNESGRFTEGVKVSENLTKHIKSDLPFFYLSSFALSFFLKENRELQSEHVESLNGNPVFLVRENSNQEGFHYMAAGFSLENPIIPIEEIERYLKTYGKMSSNDKNNNKKELPFALPPKRKHPFAKEIVKYGNLYFQSHNKIPEAEYLVKFIQENDETSYIVEMKKGDRWPFSIAGKDMDYGALDKSIMRYTKDYREKHPKSPNKPPISN